MKKIQSFTDLNNSVTRIDPKSGKMVFTKRNDDGSPSDDPNDIMSIQSVITGLGVTVDKYFLSDEVALDVADLAKKYSEVVGKGRIASIDDIRRNPEFKGALDNYVEAKLVDPNNVASILNQFSKNNYKTSYDIKDKGKEGIIYIDNSGNIPKAVITDKQKEDAAKIAKQAKVKKLILTHFSDRYKDSLSHLKEARKTFKKVDVAKDFMKVKL